MLVLIKIVQQGIVVELSPFLPHGWCCCDGLCGLPPCLYSRGVLANLANLCRNRLGSHKPLNWCEIYDLKVFMNEYNQSRGEGSIAWCVGGDYGETIWLSSLPYIREPCVSSASFAIFSHLSLSFMDFSFQKSVVFDCWWKFFCISINRPIFRVPSSNENLLGH